MTEKPESVGVGHSHAAEPRANHVRDPVVAGQSLVHERVVRREQIDDAAVLPDDGVEQQLGFASHRLEEVVV